jgi:hypothetical protein
MKLGARSSGSLLGEFGYFWLLLVIFGCFGLFFGRVVVSLLFIPSSCFPDSEGTELNFDLI